MALGAVVAGDEGQVVNRLASVSVVIPQYGNHDFTRRAVAAVLRSTYGGAVEVIVYDDASPDGPGNPFDDERVRLLVAESNQGFGPGVNRAVEASFGTLVLILNNDTLIAPTCLQRLVDVMESSDPRPGIVGPRYRTFDGETLEAGSFLGPDGSGWQLFRGHRVPAAFTAIPYQARYTSAAAILIDRDLFIESGGFDAVYAPAYYEDTDLCMRLADMGRPTVVVPEAIAYHFEGGTSGQDTASGIKAYQLRNKEVFADRWSTSIGGFPELSQRSVVTQAMALGHSRAPILWVAPHLPRPDREAGHQRMIRMIEAVVDGGDPVAFWAEHAFDAPRYGAALSDLGVRWFGDQRQRIPAERPPRYETLQDVLGVADWSAVIMSFPELAERMIPVVRSISPHLPILVDVVDLHFLREERAAEVGASPMLSPGKEWELGVYAASDGVIGSSTLETEILQRELPGLPVHTFAVAVEEPDIIPGPGTDVVFLGNFDHHPNLDAVDWWVSDIAPHLAAEPGSLKLHVFGAGSDRLADRWPLEVVSIDGWVEDLGDAFASARVFAVPLRYGAGTKGKIMAAVRHGVPVVTTAVGAESMPDSLRPALHIAEDAVGFAMLVDRFMTDDVFATEQRAAVAGAAEAAWREQRAYAAEFVSWVNRRVADPPDPRRS